MRQYLARAAEGQNGLFDTEKFDDVTDIEVYDLALNADIRNLDRCLERNLEKLPQGVSIPGQGIFLHHITLKQKAGLASSVLPY